MSKSKENKPEKVRFSYGGSDMTFAVVVLLLLGIGIVMMFSASYAIAINEGLPGYYYAERQVMFAGLGLLAMIIMSFFDYHIFQKGWIALTAYGASVILLILTVFIGTDLGTGCQRWLKFGSFSFQPSEIAKFAVVILFAYTIDKNYDKMKKITTGILPYAILLGIIVGLLMLQPHLSCTLLICMIGGILIYVGGARYRDLALLLIVGILAIGAIVAYKVMVEGTDYFALRLQTWLDPFNTELDAWQSKQSLIAIGSGGVFGLGLGESRQKYLYLPESENDFVFSIVCEELGLIGAITVILLFLLLVVQGFHIASKAPDRFGSLLAIGFTSQIGLQAFINMAVVSGVVPNTGISLPFFSYGGTALAMQLMQMGIVLNISRKRHYHNKAASAPTVHPAPAPQSGTI